MYYILLYKYTQWVKNKAVVKIYDAFIITRWYKSVLLFQLILIEHAFHADSNSSFKIKSLDPQTRHL